MKLISSWLIRFSLAFAATAFVLSQGSVAEAATKHKTTHAKTSHAKVHHQRHHVAHARVRWAQGAIVIRVDTPPPLDCSGTENQGSTGRPVEREVMGRGTRLDDVSEVL